MCVSVCECVCARVYVRMRVCAMCLDRLCLYCPLGNVFMYVPCACLCEE